MFLCLMFAVGNLVSSIEKGVIINPLSPIYLNYFREEGLRYTGVGGHFGGGNC